MVKFNVGDVVELVELHNLDFDTKLKVGDQGVITELCERGGLLIGVKFDEDLIAGTFNYSPTNKSYNVYQYQLKFVECSSVADTKEDMVNRPIHYCNSKIEPIDYMEDKLSKDGYVGYLEGNIIKYISRYRHKNGVQDLKKAEWYLKRLINTL